MRVKDAHFTQRSPFIFGQFQTFHRLNFCRIA
jgi:hypothetical protein